MAHPDGTDLYIEVISPEHDYWPLPWYLRAYPNVGWWSEVDMNVRAAPLIIAKPEAEPARACRRRAKLRQTRVLRECALQHEKNIQTVLRTWGRSLDLEWPQVYAREVAVARCHTQGHRRTVDGCVTYNPSDERIARLRRVTRVWAARHRVVSRRSAAAWTAGARGGSTARPRAARVRHRAGARSSCTRCRRALVAAPEHRGAVARNRSARRPAVVVARCA